MHSEQKIPFKDLQKSSVIGISSGASAPDQLVQSLLKNLKNDREISIEEVIVAEEKIIFKLPKQLH